MEEHNRFAGQGSVLLDIGGDVGALIVTAPASLEGLEIEIRPTHGDDTPHSHGGTDHGHGHDHGHSHDHGHGHDHGHSHDHFPHVAVVARPTANGPAYTAVYPELVEGTYELYEKLGGPVQLTVTVTGGRVEYENWPS